MSSLAKPEAEPLPRADGGKKLLTLRGHSGNVYGVAYSPDGKWLASADADNMLKVWDVSTGQELLIINGNTGEIYCVAFSPDGQWLASSSADRTIKVWDITCETNAWSPMIQLKR